MTAFDPPPGYVAMANRLFMIFQWLKETSRLMPKFRLGPPDLAIGAGIDQVPGICVDDNARDFVAALVATCREHGAEPPTYLMLRATLDLLEIPYETCSLSELGLKVGTS